ncbi:MAG TPA: hypothetical protein VMB85_14075 [Bryobacteraceae bacterium]|nr:hypothetical protein [Bryobacteraceae bacterium]
MKTAVRFFATLSLITGLASAQASKWPRSLKSGATEITVYQPQRDSLSGDILQSRAVVSVKRPGDEKAIFGAVWLITTLDLDRHRPQIRSVKIDRTRFYGIPDNEVASLMRVVEHDAVRWDDAFEQVFHHRQNAGMLTILRESSSRTCRHFSSRSTESPAFRILGQVE